jgi:BirA family biotin operon repressor/biotin-[acetyl-CoA-carboxylase] ligase
VGADNEILALKSAGVHIIHVVWPALFLGIAASVVTLVLFLDTIPYTQYLLRTQVAGDVEDLLYSMLRKDGFIKHPNDVTSRGKKLAGILTECMTGMDGVEYAVCGMGINTGGKLSGKPAGIAASIGVNRTILAAAAADAFLAAYDTFLKEGLGGFIDGFRKRNMLSGIITVTEGNDTITGGFSGFDDEGALLLDCKDGKRRFIAGEVSVRGEGFYV